MSKVKLRYLFATLMITTTIALFLIFEFVLSGHSYSEESSNGIAYNQKNNMNSPVIKKIIDSYNNSDKLYLFHFGSMTCAPCVHEFENYNESSGSDQFRQVIVILLEDDKIEFNKRFDFSKFGIDVLCYKEKGFTNEEVIKLGNKNVGFSLLYDGTGQYLTNDEETMNNYLYGYKLGFLTAQLKYNPKDFNAHFEWAQLMDSRGRYNEAIAEFKLCKELNPDHIEARFLLSTVYYRAGIFEKAIEEIESIIPKAPDQMRSTFNTVLNEYKRALEAGQKTQKSKNNEGN